VGHDSEAVLKRRRRNHKISTIIAKSGAQLAPTSDYLQIERQNPFAVESQYAIELSRKRSGEIRVSCTLLRNSAFDLADRNDAKDIQLIAMFWYGHAGQDPSSPGG
jgi:hypothetical protein